MTLAELSTNFLPTLRPGRCFVVPAQNAPPMQPPVPPGYGCGCGFTSQTPWPFPVAPPGIQMIPRMDEKSSADEIDYSVDLTQWFGGSGDTIVSINPYVVNPTGYSYELTPIATGIFNDGLVATVLVASGPPGAPRTLNIEVTTNEGRKFTQALLIPINRVTVATDPPDGPVIPDAALLVGGQAITVNSQYITP